MNCRTTCKLAGIQWRVLINVESLINRVSDPRRRSYAVKRIPPSSKLRQEVEAVFIGWEAEGHPLDNFVRLEPDICFT